CCVLRLCCRWSTSFTAATYTAKRRRQPVRLPAIRRLPRQVRPPRRPRRGQTAIQQAATRRTATRTQADRRPGIPPEVPLVPRITTGMEATVQTMPVEPIAHARNLRTTISILAAHTVLERIVLCLTVRRHTEPPAANRFFLAALPRCRVGGKSAQRRCL